MENQNSNQKYGFAIAAFILGYKALLISYIPVISFLSCILGFLALVFAIVAFFRKNLFGLSLAGCITGVIALILAITINFMFFKYVPEASEFFSTAQSSIGLNTKDKSTEKVEVTFGKFKVNKSGRETSLPVTVKNTSGKTASFMIKIEAMNKDGSRISEDYVWASDLKNGQSQTFNAFTYVDNDKISAFKEATFGVLSVH